MKFRIEKKTRRLIVIEERLQPSYMDSPSKIRKVWEDTYYINKHEWIDMYTVEY